MFTQLQIIQPDLTREIKPSSSSSIYILDRNLQRSTVKRITGYATTNQIEKAISQAIVLYANFRSKWNVFKYNFERSNIAAK